MNDRAHPVFQQILNGICPKADDKLVSDLGLQVREGATVPTPQIRPPMDDEEIARVAKIGPTLAQEREDEVPRTVRDCLNEARDILSVTMSESMEMERKPVLVEACRVDEELRKLLEQCKEIGLVS